MINFAKWFAKFPPTKVSLSVKHCVYQKLAADKDETMEEL